MYPDAMFTFAAASETLMMPVSEILEILDLTPQQAEKEDLSADEIVEAVEDCFCGDDEWGAGDSWFQHYG